MQSFATKNSNAVPPFAPSLPRPHSNLRLVGSTPPAFDPFHNRGFGFPQEYITPYTPEQNGVVERFFRSLKEECVWQHRFKSFPEASRTIRKWMDWYNESRPHQALGYLAPRQFRAAQQRQQVA